MRVKKIRICNRCGFHTSGKQCPWCYSFDLADGFAPTEDSLDLWDGDKADLWDSDEEFAKFIKAEDSP